MDNYKLRINNTTTFLAWGSRLTKSISLCLEFYWSYISIDVVKRVINVWGKYLNDKVFTCLKIRLKKLLTAHIGSFIVGGISKAFTIIRSALPENRQLLYHIPAQNWKSPDDEYIFWQKNNIFDEYIFWQKNNIFSEHMLLV